MLTMADKGGRGGRQMLTMADKGGRGGGGKANADIGLQREAGVLATNDITDKMIKNSIYFDFSLTNFYILIILVNYCVSFC